MSECIKIMLNQNKFALSHIRLFLKFLTLIIIIIIRAEKIDPEAFSS